jgi:serine protease AprX
MAKKYRVIAHGMHEAEIAKAKSVMPTGQATEAFVTGVADQAQIDEMSRGGLVVQKVAEVDDQNVPVDARAETPGAGTRTISGQFRSRTISRTLERAPGAAAEVDLSRPNVYLIQIKGPLLPDYRQRLEALGVKLMEGYRNDFYSAFLTPQQVGSVGGLGFVATVQLFDSGESAPSAGAAFESLSPEAPASGVRRMLTYDVRLHRAEDLAKVKGWFDQQHVAVAGASGRKIRIYLLEDAPVFSDLVGLPEVERCEEYIEPKLFNDRARLLMRIDSNPAGAAFPFDGAGEIVAVADTGIDDQHPDFAGRLAPPIALGRPGRSDDPNGHGTHVAGSVLGDGKASNGDHKGVAPAAKLFFQSLLDSGGGLGGLPLDLGELFEQAYQAGARIHNNSWGAATASTYTLNSNEVDEFVSKRRDMLVVIAAGNEGQASNRRNTPAGVVDWLSLGAPATAKNALTVGASRSDRSDGGLSQSTWGATWSNKFPDPPIGAELVSGDPEALAAFSSRGPSDDRRIKPDIVAPGTDILSTKSAIAPITHFWGTHANASYAYMGGTSMATPLVSGCAALVRQYYVGSRNHEPSAALLRATLINGARWLKGRDANESNPAGVVPDGNYDQGFGCVNMSATVPNPGQPGLELDFEDNWKVPARQLPNTGARRRFMLQVGGARSLRICLAYTDPPGRGLQNNLNLFVQTPDNTKLFGNQQLRQSLSIPDVDNNVEVVRIDNPKPGAYLIQVTATNLLRSPQDFALVVTGDLAGATLQNVG